MSPSKVDTNANIPVIDLKGATAPQQLLDAAADNGFIFIKHTEDMGLPPKDVEEMFNLSRSFFNAPQPVKSECTISSNTGGKNHGYIGPGNETLDPSKGKADQKEAFNFGLFDRQTSQPQQPLSGPLKEQSHRVDLFMRNCHRLCTTILTMLGAALQIDAEHGGAEWFAHRHVSQTNSSIMRMLYYPAAKANGSREDIRAGAHSDYGSVTLLFRLPGQPGLEILTKAGEWAAVPVDPEVSSGSQPNGASAKPPPILVNIGDVLSYWTNGLLKSTVHRVVFPPDGPGEERYSIAYFCQPDDDAELVEVPSPLVKKAGITHGVEKMAGVKTAKDHLNARLAATYKVG